MVDVAVRDPQLDGEGPTYLDPTNVQYWCRHAKMLQKKQVSKARKFLEYSCIKYLGVDHEFGSRHCFVCLPLNKAGEWAVPWQPSPLLAKDEQYTLNTGENSVLFEKKPYPQDYNSSEYKIYRNQNGRFECNCQGWQTRETRGEGQADGCNCSHVLALFFAFKIKQFKRRGHL